MNDRQLMDALALKLMSKNSKIKDLEKENAGLKASLAYNIEALSKADKKLIDVKKS